MGLIKWDLMGNLMFYIWGRLIFCWDMFYNNWKHIGKMLGTCSESSFDGLKPLFPSCRGKLNIEGPRIQFEAGTLDWTRQHHHHFPASASAKLGEKLERCWW
jgi:hypothetical protein